MKRGRLRNAWPVGAGLVASMAGTVPCFAATEPLASDVPAAATAVDIRDQGKAAEDSANSLESDTPRAALDPALPLEDRRYLLYLYARVNSPRVAEALARRILEEKPNDKQTLLVLAGMYLERKDAARVTECANQLLKYYPNDSEALYFQASGCLLAGQYERAEAVYRTLKERNYTRESYPYAMDLANAATKAGHWREAIGAYQELLKSHGLSEPMRLEIRRAIEGLYREHLPGFSLSSTNYFLRPGQVYSLSAAYRQHVTDTSTLRFGYQRFEVRLDGGDGFKCRRTPVNDGQLELTTDWSNEFTTGIWGGAGADYGMGGANLRWERGGARHALLDGRLGERAVDSLLIESLNGRENRLSAFCNYRFDKSWYGQGSVFGREVAVSRQHAGWGGGADWSLERVLFRGRPEWHAGYQGSYSRFSWADGTTRLLESSLAGFFPPAAWEQLRDNAIRSELHREGVYTVWRRNESGVLAYYTLVGVDYAFDRSAWEYRLGAGCSYYPRKSIELTPEVTYTSGANTSDVDSERLQIGIAIRNWF